MSDHSTFTTATPDEIRRLERWCDQFEAAWKAGQQPVLDDFLEQADEHLRQPLLRELLPLDWEYRIRRGDTPQIDEYANRFPNVETLLDTIQHDIPNTATLLNPPERLAQYYIERELGRGGMGVVYAAQDELLGRRVALKVLRTINLSDLTARERFRREAQLTARLQHPHVVQIYEVGEHQGQPFLALEFVNGPSLSEHLQRTPQPPEEAAALVAVLSRAIHYAHTQGIVHRDLKPANVLLAVHVKDGSEESNDVTASTRVRKLTSFIPKVTDFGLAHPMGEGDLTATGVIVGTPAYMAPEQTWGKSEQQLIGPAVDIYALGAILYEILTGRPVFQGITVFDALEQVRTQVPVAPSRLQPLVPRDLETICLKCLAKEPEKRYSSAQALADDLQCFLSGDPISARPSGLFERAIGWSRRNKPQVAAGILAIVALLSASALAINYAFTIQIRRAQLLTQDALKEATYQRVQAEDTAAELAKQQRITRNALHVAESVRLQAEQLSANYAMERGLSMMDQGDVASGMLMLGRSLELTQPASNELEHVVRTILGEARGRLTYKPFAIIEHGGEAQALAFSPDNQALWTGSRLSPPRRFDPATGNQVGEALAHPNEIRALSVSRDGRFVASAGTDKSARVWDAVSGAAIGLPFTHKHWVQSVAFSPDGQFVLTGSADGTARLWEMTTGELRQSYLPPGWIQAVAFHPDGKTVAIAAATRVWLFETQSGRAVGEPMQHQGEVWAIAFSPNRQLLLTGSEENTARLWDGASGKPLGFPLLHQGPVRTVGFSLDGTVIWTGDATGKVRLWNVNNMTPLGTPLQHASAVYAIAANADLSRLATGSAAGKVRLWEKNIVSNQTVTLKHERLAYSAALSPDGKTIATGTADQEVRFWSTQTGEPVHQPLKHDASILSLAFSPDGRYIVSGSTDKSARLWNVAEGTQCGMNMMHDDHVYSVAFSPDGKLVATGAKDNTARLWQAISGQPVGEPIKLAGWVHAVAFSSNNKWLATGCEDTTAQLWDVTTLKPIGEAMKHRGPVRTIAFSPDGQKLVTGTWDEGTVRLWRVPTGTPLDIVMSHQNHVLSVEFSPNGKSLASGTWDGTARLWDVATGKPLGSPMLHQRTVRDVSFSPDGMTLWTASFDRTVRSWQLPQPIEGSVPQVLQQLKVLTGMELDANGLFRDLDVAEWEELRR